MTECLICYNFQADKATIIYLTNCVHSLCNFCLGKLQKRACPFCRTSINVNDVTSVSSNNIINESSGNFDHIIANDSEIPILRVQQRRRRRRRRRRNSEERRRRNTVYETFELSDGFMTVATTYEIQHSFRENKRQKKHARQRNQRTNNGNRRKGRWASGNNRNKGNKGNKGRQRRRTLSCH